MLRFIVLAAIGIGCSVLVWSTVNSTSAGAPMYGDSSCDGQVNSIDAAVILQHVAALLDAKDCPANADANGDQAISSVDAALVLQFGARLIPALGPGVEPATPTPTPPPTPTPQQCPDGYFWNPNKGHCDSRECPPGFVFDEETLYCVFVP